MNQPIKWWHAVMLAAALAFISNFIMFKIAYSIDAKDNVASKQYVKDYVDPIKSQVTSIKEVNDKDHERIQKELDSKTSNAEFKILVEIVKDNNRMLKEMPKK